MSYYQFFSGTLAFLLVVAWVVPILRHRWWGVVVVSGLSFGLPAIGFAVYAIGPGPSPADAAVLYLVGLLYLAMIVALVMRFTRRRRLRPSPLVYTSANETRRYLRGVAGRAFLVLWLSGLLFLVEPGFAIANLALNAGWMALWIPRRWRTRQVQNSVLVSAAPGRAFEFVTNPKNWALYVDELELVEVKPDGPLAAGSEYVTRTVIPPTLQTTSHRQIENRYRVIAMVPQSSYTVTWSDEPGYWSRTDFLPVDSGTRITFTRTMMVSFAQASQGVTLNLPRALAVARASEARRNARLKEVLEQAPSQ